MYFKTDADLVILRRQYDRNRQFEIHIKKLKEVNGFKQHNLMIKGQVRSDNPFIYINNPVESKIPHAYLTLEEFKEALTKRVQKQRSQLTTKRRYPVLLTKKPNRQLKVLVSGLKATSPDVKNNLKPDENITYNSVSSINSTVSQSKSEITTQHIANATETNVNNVISGVTDKEDIVKSADATRKDNFSTNIITTAKLEELIFLRAQSAENSTVSENYTNLNTSDFENTNETDNGNTTKEYNTETIINDTTLEVHTKEITIDTDKEGINQRSKAITTLTGEEGTIYENISTNTTEGTNLNEFRVYTSSMNPITKNLQSIEVSKWIINNDESKKLTFQRDISIKTTTKMSLDTIKYIPKRLVRNTEIISFDKTPWRKRTPNKKVTKRKPSSTKRSTLGNYAPYNLTPEYRKKNTFRPALKTALFVMQGLGAILNQLS
ncbi:unnamed protein product [Leptosia nina]|uniref:Uncharacterized protein n=1 Tax=Leptosia nina TaxID=320188 RepID=A0AAV1J3M9_9NEOP